MTRHLVLLGGLLITVATAPALPAQQPNQPSASLVFSGRDGPPFPITAVYSVSLSPSSLAIPMQVRGAPSVPFTVFLAGGVLPAGIPVAGVGLIDLDVTGPLFLLMDGINLFNAPGALHALAHTSGTGTATITFILTSGASGFHFAAQAVIADPGSPTGFTFTAATDLVFVP